ncbi:MAG: nucleotidyltransferase [Nanoarchaeota archaeon]|nr:nucleotidyltransferase [Nanoarchaeota archaeon]MBU1028440.1 nucleotidyltransferase [Nanoarchaeota archaeon]
MEITLVYLVAGISSRFGGKIKQLAKIGPDNETLIEYSLKQTISAGITKIIFIVGEKTEKPFKEMFGDNYKGIPVYYAFQTYDKTKRDKPWGTLDSLFSAKSLINSPFIVCGGDDIYGKKAFEKLVKHLKNNSNNATIGYKLKNVLSEKGTVNRGIFQVDLDNNVTEIKEYFKIDSSNLNEKGLTKESLCSMLLFALQPNIFDMLEEKIIKFKQEHQEDRTKEVLAPEEIGKLIQEKKITMKCYPTEEEWIGITNPEDEYYVKKKLIKKI